MKINGIVIAGTNSGCGKTTISMGIMAALVERGLKVQPYKAGPDFIDPMFHTYITGRDSRNLDSWMLSEDTVKYLYSKNSADADISIVEGVMGLYDGYGGISIEGSTADVSRIIGAPVIIVINGEGMSLSAAALVKGFVDFDKSINIKGIIINNISSEGHFNLLKEVIETNTGVAVLGYLRSMRELAIEKRHLGLVTSSEIKHLKEKASLLSSEIQQTVDIDQLIKLSGESVQLDVKSMQVNAKSMQFDSKSMQVDAKSMQFQVGEKIKIAVAKDKAFCFYYKDNLELFEMLGAEIEYFSPTKDAVLPRDIDALYIGGGYPEIWAQELQDNDSMRMDIKNQIKNGLPAYAECGGLMYLSDGIVTKENKEFEMVGLIPGKSYMTSSLKRFGYVFVKLTQDTLMATKESEIRAHEFHYSEISTDQSATKCYEVSKRKDGMVTRSWNCGYKAFNLLAGYPHIHFWANPEFAIRFLKSAKGYN